MKFLILVEIVEVVFKEQFEPPVFVGFNPFPIGFKCTHTIDETEFEIDKIFEVNNASIFVKKIKCKMLDVLEFEGHDGIFS